MIRRILIALGVTLCLLQAQAAMAPWYRWESQVDGRLVCSQWSPGDGWKRFAGPYSNGGCRDR